MATSRDVSEQLAAIRPPGSFATRQTSRADDLRLEVTGVGPIAWPITSATARQLCKAARPARYGLKDQTRLDPEVRDTCEIPKSRVSIDERQWKITLLPMLDRIRKELGLADGSRLKAALHNMLIYGPGQFFLPHQDSEKTDHMIGTLVVTLPSDFTGGAIVIEHQDERVSFRGSASQLTFIAFYADCHHEVRPVKAGYRVVLTYNLSVEGDTSTATRLVAPGQVTSLAQCVKNFFQTPRPGRWGSEGLREPPDRLVYLLDHQYTQKGLAWSRLKNADAARASALQDVARRLDCEILLALADVHESWSCEDEEPWGGGYRDRGGWLGEGDEDDDQHEEEGDGDERPSTPALDSLMESDIELRHWIGSGDELEAIIGDVDDDEVCYTTPSAEFEPFQSEHEGYMGNWGNTVDRWYHRAAVVLWPRERDFVIRAKAVPRWAIAEIRKVLGTGDAEKAREMARRLAPFWSRVTHREEGRAFLDRTLVVSALIDDPDAAAALLRPFTLTRLTPSTGPRLVSLSDRYGIEWCRALFTAWAAEDRHDLRHQRLTWVASLPDLCRPLCIRGSAHGRDLARWIVANEWARIVEQWKQPRTHAEPRHALEASAEMSKPIVGLLESCVISESPGVHAEVLGFLTSSETDYPVGRLVEMLRAAQKTRAPALVRGLGLAPLHAHCVQALTTRLRDPVREKDNWSIALPRTCRCRLCGLLADFLAAPTQIRFEWPLAKDHRAHIHGVLDAHALPVTHVTRHAGRPHTLVLVKTEGLFAGEAAQRHVWERDVRWLAKTTGAFSG